MALPSHRRNPVSGRPGRAERLAPPAPGYPPRRVIAGWRAELVAEDWKTVLRGLEPAARRRWVHAWWAGLDVAAASDEEIAEIWAWRRRDAVDPAPDGWDVLMELYRGDRERLKRDLADELAEREARAAAQGRRPAEG